MINIFFNLGYYAVQLLKDDQVMLPTLEHFSG